MKRLLPLLVLLLAACSSDPAPSSPAPTWLGLQPGDARSFTGDAGELTLIYVDETYAIDGVNASAVTYEHDDRYVTDYFLESAGDLEWYGRRGEWRAGRRGETPRPVSLEDDTVTFGDITITLSPDGPTSVETPDGVFRAD
ncbi:hypothetical protein [Nocardioides pyridinolyticus]